jgi:ketosteroid isomerase-like protein
MKKIILGVLISSTLFACKTNTEAFDLTKAKADIAEGNNNFEMYVSKGDSVGLAANCYTIDANVLNPNSPAVEGRKAIESFMSGIIKAGITGIKLTTKEVWGDENTLTEQGTFALNIKDGTVVENAKYLVLWKKEDGKWKLHRDCFNSDTPAAPAAK